MKKVGFILTCVSFLLFLSACGGTERGQEIEREEYAMTYEKQLQRLDVFLSQDVIDDEEWNDGSRNGFRCLGRIGK